MGTVYGSAEITLASSRSSSKAISKDKESLSNNIPKESEQIPREETKKKNR